MPVDHLGQRLDHRQRTHPGILQHRPGGVPQSEAADHHVEAVAGKFGQGEAGEFDLRHREQTRHEELVTELDLVHVDLQGRIQPPSQAHRPHGGFPPVKLLETPAQPHNTSFRAVTAEVSVRATPGRPV